MVVLSLAKCFFNGNHLFDKVIHFRVAWPATHAKRESLRKLPVVKSKELLPTLLFFGVTVSSRWRHTIKGFDDGIGYQGGSFLW